jgi:uncharacterized iron-regulated membrane protein
MTWGDQWIYRPQNVWLRKVFFQVHLWIGIGLGIYVLLISLSGSAIVFRNEISKAFGSRPKRLPISGPKLSRSDLKDAARRAYPQYSVSYIWESKQANEATEIWLAHDGKTKMRLFDPYTGRDVGASVPPTIQVLTFMIDLHINLLSGRTGRTLNGIGAILTTLLALSGAIIWWPGMQNWRNSLMVRRESNWKRLNWSLHSAVGIWTLAFVLVWGITGIFVVFPTPFEKTINFFSPLAFYRLDGPPAAKMRVAQPANSAAASKSLRGLPPVERSLGDKILRWFYYLHFGNFAGAGVKALWVLFGLAPVFLFVTGVLMWWNRVLRRAFEQDPAARFRPSEIQSMG